MLSGTLRRGTGFVLPKRPAGCTHHRGYGRTSGRAFVEIDGNHIRAEVACSAGRDFPVSGGIAVMMMVTNSQDLGLVKRCNRLLRNDVSAYCLSVAFLAWATGKNSCGHQEDYLLVQSHLHARLLECRRFNADDPARNTISASSLLRSRLIWRTRN